MKLHALIVTLLSAAVFFCSPARTRADDAADYSRHIAAAQAALKAGQVDAAATEAEAAIALCSL